MLLGIGRLVSLEVLGDDGRVRVLPMRGRWLAWDGRRFHIVERRAKRSAALPARTKAMHRRFHRADPRGAYEVVSPDPVNPLRQVGLLKALTYDSSDIDSPSKQKYHWHHAFGDTGHKGGSYPTRVMPALKADAKGNLFIVRRPGNIFRVDEWLRG